MKLIIKKTGEVPKIGETYISKRKEPHVLMGMVIPACGTGEGRIYTDRGEYFPSVLGMEWVEEENKA